MLADLITIDLLEDLAGKKVFWRGEAYYSNAAVRRVRMIGDKLTAKVEGTETYQVELWDDDGDLAYDCTCPHAAEGNFCKHCVAVGLAWLAGAADLPESDAGPRPDPWRLIRDYLATQPAEILIDLLLEIVQRDDRLYQSLLLKAERSGAGSDQAKIFRRAINAATQVNGSGADDFADDLGTVIDSLDELLQPNTAALLVDLTEYAIERAEAAAQEIDDEEGEAVEIMDRLNRLHLDACELARPDPVELATRLFRLEAQLSFNYCSFDPFTYREVLGETGLRRYRELVEAEWRELGPRSSKSAYDAHRLRITRLMERLAEASGDIEELVSIRSQDLTSAYRYLDIAELWVKAGEPEKALDWAERGLKAFPERPDNRLRDFLAVAYLERGRHDEALQLTWIQFEEQPELAHYRKLHAVADKLGRWTEQRERALAWLDETIVREAATTNRWKTTPSVPDYSRRLEIALWENDLDAAWMTAQQGASASLSAGTCDRRLLIALADQIEASRPEDAIALYRRVVPSIVQQTNNTAYDEAIKLIRKIGGLMKTLDRTRQFAEYLAELRIQYKPKRNFIKLLDRI
ncbi:SWIM zinc finger family protein [Thiocystis violascens]|uniref:SWIM-type domain-containing protein n=1 Tax=Thiocystis violascens (strain ATCC 17096 / DSM 198 / 6111) TaxID=765911 RepID=I3YED2_THIV6|nr:DUF6880 family protein [Thiocystis violascens]AFL75350.1 hypothetical protein Thivi_3483 [Thiocystis violascens DSM 198]